MYRPPKRMRAGAEVRGQGVVAVCVIPDEFGECLLKVLGCFESTAEAETWVRNVASRVVTEDDVLIAPTCDWFYPNAVGKPAADHYRIPELQRIMDAAERNPKAVQEFKDWQRREEEKAKQAAELEPMSE